MVRYLSADECSKLHLVKVYPGAGSSLKWINAVIGTLAAKRSIMDWCVNRVHAQALIICWRRQSFNAENPGWDTGDQLESPLNSGQLNPAYITHLDQWVSLAEEYGIYIIFQEWFSPMRAAERGEWTGYDDAVFHQNWANFYNVLAAHFAGRQAVAGFISCEEVVANVPVGTTTIEEWPYTITCSAPFNSLWNSIMTKLSLAVHQGDSNFNFIASPTVDWGGGASSLGSKADYPNAWQHLADPNPHVLYRVMWNPWNQIKTDIDYPYDDSLNRGVVNYHRETGTPIMLECLVSWVPSWPGGVWVWDAAGLQWESDILKALSNEGIGLNMGAYGKSSAIPYCIFDDLGNEQPWVQIYSETIELLKHFLIITAGVGGTTNPSPETYQYNDGMSVVIAAIPNASYRFVQWEINGTIRTENPTTILMNTTYSLRAAFEALPPPPPEKTNLTIVAINGQTNPAQGTHEIDKNLSITITATPNVGYSFKQWTVDNAQAGTTPFITVTMDTNHTAVAECELAVTPAQAGFPIWIIPVVLGGLGAIYLLYK